MKGESDLGGQNFFLKGKNRKEDGTKWGKEDICFALLGTKGVGVGCCDLMQIFGKE